MSEFYYEEIIEFGDRVRPTGNTGEEYEVSTFSCRSFYSYGDLVEFQRNLRGFDMPYPFLKFTGRLLSVNQYLDQMSSMDEVDLELALATIIATEVDAVVDYMEEYSYMLVGYAENIFDERGLSEEEVNALFDNIYSWSEVQFFVETDKEVPISDVFSIEPEFLGSHDFPSKRGALKFEPYFIPGVSPEEVEYNVRPGLTPKHGQRKLFCDFSDACEYFSPKTVIFVGAYSAHGIDVFAASRPDITIYCTDLKKPVVDVNGCVVASKVKGLDDFAYSPNMIWFDRIEEVSYDPAVTLFYSDIYTASDASEMYQLQVEYMRKLGARFNSLKRLVDWNVSDLPRIAGSLWCHQVWAGSGGELRERFEMEDEIKIVSESAGAYERHICFYENSILTGGAYVKSKWTACECYSCKVFQSCLDRAYVSAVKHDSLDMFKSKVKRLDSRKGMQFVQCEETFTDIFGDEVLALKDGSVEKTQFPPLFVTAICGGVEELYVAPGCYISEDEVYYWANGTSHIKKVSDPFLPLALQLSLLWFGKILAVKGYRLVRASTLSEFKSNLVVL